MITSNTGADPGFSVRGGVKLEGHRPKARSEGCRGPSPEILSLRCSERNSEAI